MTTETTTEADLEQETIAEGNSAALSEPIENATKPSESEAPEVDPGGKPMTFWEHLEELRKRLMWSIGFLFFGCAIAWYFRDRMLEWLWFPYKQAWLTQKLPGLPTLHFPAPGAGFVAYFKLSMIGGAALASPFISYEVWSFVAPGLYAKEKRYVVPFVLLSSALFVGGGYFGWRAAFPISFSYFLGLSNEAAKSGLTIVPTMMMGDYVDFCVQMLVGFGLVFEMPLLFLFLSMIGVLNYLHLIKYGRYFILVAFIISAIITPPDVPDQLAMAIPMCMLYGVSIGLAYFFGKKPTEAQREAYRQGRKKKTA